MMSTLANAFDHSSNATAIIVPRPKAVTFSYKQLSSEILSFQHKLAKLGLTPGGAVSIAIPNSYEFIVAFLASSWQRGIAAPLNPAYKQEEFEFYIDDLSSAIALVPKGAVQTDAAAVRAARKYGAAIAECYWNGNEVVLDVKDKGKLAGKGNQRLEKAQPEDTALVLHTSGTTGRPKAVPLTHRNLTRTICTWLDLTVFIDELMPDSQCTKYIQADSARPNDACHAFVPRSRPARGIPRTARLRWLRRRPSEVLGVGVLGRLRGTQGKLVYGCTNDASDFVEKSLPKEDADNSVHSVLLLSTIAEDLP